MAGSWWPADYAGPPLVSIEDEVAEAYGVGIGDSLSFNVLGRVIEAKIASLRPEIDWSQGRLDFVFLFSPGVLEAAPHTFAAAVEVPQAQEAALWIRWRRRSPTSRRSPSARWWSGSARCSQHPDRDRRGRRRDAAERHPGAGRRGRGRAAPPPVRGRDAQGAGRPALGSAAHLRDRVSRPRRHGGARRRASSARSAPL